jgi:membrane protease YdiL (CAAX protease family)
MNYLPTYCVACLVLCAVGIFRRLNLKNVECIGVDALNITGKQGFRAFFIFLLITIPLPFLLILLPKMLLADHKLDDNVLALVTICITQIASLLFVAKIYGHLRLKNKAISLPSTVVEVACGFAVALPTVLLLSYLWLWILIVIGKHWTSIPLHEQSSIVLFNKLSGGFQKFLFSVVVVILAPAVEEFIFRGGIYRIFLSTLSRRFATILTSIIFAILHFNLVSLVPLFVLSVMLTREYERFGNLYIPIIIHAAFNCNSLILIALS